MTLSAAQRELVRCYYVDDKMPMTKIAKKIGISYYAAKELRQKIRETGSTARKPGSGKKTTRRAQRASEKAQGAAQEDPTVSVREVAFATGASGRTVRRALRKMGENR